MRRRLPTLLVAVAALALLAPALACSETPDEEGEGEVAGARGGGGTLPSLGFAAGDELAVSVEPQEVGFGVVALGESATAIVTIEHIGQSGTLELDVSLDATSDELTIEGGGPYALEPAGQHEVVVRYAPVDGAADEGVLLVATNAPTRDGGALIAKVPIFTGSLSVDLSAKPKVLDVGEVPTGESGSAEVLILNTGTAPVEATSVEITGSSEFSAELPAVTALVPGESLTVAVEYTPVGFDSDEGTLVLGFTSALGQEDVQVALEGREVTPAFHADPSPLDFGMRPAGQTHWKTLVLRNAGFATLEVTSVAVDLITPWADTIGVEPLPEGGLALGADESAPVKVSFTPGDEMAPLGMPIAELIFQTNDPAGPEQRVPVDGTRLGTGLEVHPPDLISFGFVGVGGAVLREVILYNAGFGAISVDKVFVEGPFSIVDTGAWGPTQPEPSSAPLGPGKTHPLALRYGNDGSLLETQWGKLTIQSDDEARPVWDVVLNAQAVVGDACLVQMLPNKLDWGPVLPGSVGARTMSLVNIGKTPCDVLSVVPHDCEVGAGGVGISTCGEEPSAHYVVAEAPAPGTTLAPEDTAQVTVAFTAPPATQDITPYPGLLELRLQALDPEGGGAKVEVIVPSGAWWSGPNLDAWVGVGELLVTPPELELGVVPIGCKSPAAEVVAKNIGLAAVEVQEWWLEGCPETVGLEVAEGVEAPALLLPAESLTFALQHVPGEPEVVACELHIVGSDAGGERVVPLTSEGAWPAERVDTFTDSASQLVDVIFVVDDSGSMYEEQDNLAKSFGAFIETAASWHSDFRIGVTTTTVDPFDFEGGELKGSPTWVTEGSWEKFLNNVKVGTGGSGDEKGLWGAKLALSPPHTDETDTPCLDDDDCKVLHTCKPAGFCGGANAGFLRQEASLELVFVSDEEDSSPETLEQYLNFFRAMKGFDHPELLHTHAIVGPPGGCTSDNGTAWAGHRYISLAQATGGITVSICEPDFSKGLAGIGEIAFAAKMSYPLSQPPAPTTIEVDIEGVPCPLLSLGVFNWVWDAEVNTVTLTEEGICSAAPGDLVEIRYQLLCYEAAGEDPDE